MSTYTDQLRSTLAGAGVNLSPVLKRGEKAFLRYDAVEVTDSRVTFLWLGRPVWMADRTPDNLVHLRGEVALQL